MDELITDLIPFEGDKEIVLLWDNFTNPVSRILRHLLSQAHGDQVWKNGIAYQNLEGLKISDVAKLPYVGEIRVAQVIDELSTIFQTFEDEGMDGSIAKLLDFEAESNLEPDSIDQAETLADIVSGIIEAYNDYRRID